MLRVSLIFILSLYVIILAIGLTVYTGIRSGEIQTKIVTPLKTAADLFVQQASKIPDTLSVPPPQATGTAKNYRDDPTLIRRNSYMKAINTAYMKFSEGDQATVIQMATEALTYADTNEEKAVAHYWIGLGKYRQGDIRTAEEEENEAIRLKPDYAAPYTTLSAISMEKRDFLTSLALAQKSAELDPNYPWAYNNQGIALVQLGRKAEGLEMFRKAIRLAPDSYIFKDNLTRAENVQ